MVHTSITIITYVLIELLKPFIKDNKKIPLISATIGLLISIVSYYLNEELLRNITFLETIELGILSGLAATGSNEIIKNILKRKGKDYEN